MNAPRAAARAALASRARPVCAGIDADGDRCGRKAGHDGEHRPVHDLGPDPWALLRDLLDEPEAEGSVAAVPSEVADEIYRAMQLFPPNNVDPKVYVPCRLSGEERGKVLDIIGREVARQVAIVQAEAPTVRDALLAAVQDEIAAIRAAVAQRDDELEVLRASLAERPRRIAWGDGACECGQGGIDALRAAFLDLVPGRHDEIADLYGDATAAYVLHVACEGDVVRYDNGDRDQRLSLLRAALRVPSSLRFPHAGGLCACGYPMSRNPHVRAGRTDTLLTVGAEWVCIPCAIASLHRADRRAAEERRLREAEEAEGDAARRWFTAWPGKGNPAPIDGPLVEMMQHIEDMGREALETRALRAPDKE